MTNSSIKAAAIAFALASAPASAAIIEDVTLNFESGATWTGTITFNDDYQGMIDTDGTLTGGSNNYNEYFHWTWWDGTGQANPQDSNGDGLLNDWLMNGTEGGSYSMYIGLSWDADTSSFDGGLNLGLLDNPYFSGISTYHDNIVSYTGVPEPASIALLGLGLVGLGAARRRKA